MKNIPSRGFTLIELLVVISIIGLLSSVVLASLNTARDRGRIAAAQKFAVGNYRTLGADAALYMTFDDTTNIGKDESATVGNNGTVVGTVTTSTDTSGGQGASISVPGGNGSYISTPNSLNMGVSSFTVGHWVRTTNNAGQAFSVANTPNAAGWRFGISNGLIRFMYGTSAGAVESNCGTRTVNDNRWHYIAGSFDTVNGRFDCYIDGAYVTSITSPFLIPPTGYNIDAGRLTRIGYAHCCGATGFSGLIDNVSVYKQALTSQEMQDLYAQELENRDFAQSQ